MIRLLLLLVAAFTAWPAAAHKASDAYLQLASAESGLSVRVDVALRDLDVALDLDADGDGRLTWGEIRTAWPAIEAYVVDRIRIDGCPMRLADRGLERRSDGAYAALKFESSCVPRTEPVIRYALMREFDATHRGIAKIELPDRPPVVRVLDPASDGAMQPTVAERGAPAHTATAFLREGVMHILTGYDHVLFLLCLLLPAAMRRTPQGWRPVASLDQAVLPVAGIVTAFTLAHSVTLALAALKLVSLPAAVIEPAVAATIVLAALDNVRPIFRGRRAWVAFAFGLIHGFGFAGALAELDLPTSAFAWALLQFNLGLEVGQLMIVLAVTSALYLLRASPRYPAWVIRGGSCAAIVVGVLWFVERTIDVSVLPL